VTTEKWKRLDRAVENKKKDEKIKKNLHKQLLNSSINHIEIQAEYIVNVTK